VKLLMKNYMARCQHLLYNGICAVLTDVGLYEIMFCSQQSLATKIYEL
jgi:hypothetical protein